MSALLAGLVEASAPNTGEHANTVERIIDQGKDEEKDPPRPRGVPSIQFLAEQHPGRLDREEDLAFSAAQSDSSRKFRRQTNTHGTENDEDDEDPNDIVDDDDDDDHSFPRSDTLSSVSTLLGDPLPNKSLLSRFKSMIYPKPSPIEEFIPNYRHAPIVSGLVIPFSILLEIPALTAHWYIRTVENAVVESQPNPFILDLGLGFSMICAVIANLALVIRFMEKYVWEMTVVCIVFLSIHDIINITAVTIFGIEHRFSDGFTYGQPFWMTVCSTTTSVFTNLTLIWDLIRTPKFSRSGSGLTQKQRSLVIIVILLLCYIALGSLVNNFLIADLAFIDALYFTVASIETIGFGDIVPITTGARVFMCIYAGVGIINLAVAVGMARETVLEALEVSYRLRVEAMKERRKDARRWRRIEKRWREAIEWRLSEKGEKVWVKDDNYQQDQQEGAGRLSSAFKFMTSSVSGRSGMSLPKRLPAMLAKRTRTDQPRGMHLNLEVLSRAQLEAAAMEVGIPLESLLPEGFRFKEDSQQRWRKRLDDKELGFNNSAILDNGTAAACDATIPLTHARMGRMITMIGSFALAMNRDAILRKGAKTVERPQYSNTSMAQQILLYDDDDRKVLLDSEEKKAFYARLTVACLLFLTFWMSGAAIFSKTEGWTFGQGLYFCYISFTTLGYGDFSPKTPAGRSVFVLWALLGVATMTILISVVSEAYSNRYKKAVHSVAFAKAVKRYRARARSMAAKTGGLGLAKLNVGDGDMEYTGAPRNATTTDSEIHNDAVAPAISTENLLDERLTIAKLDDGTRHDLDDIRQAVESLPHEILHHARTFHTHLRYFVGGNSKSPHVPKNGRQGQRSDSPAADVNLEVGLDDDDVPRGVKQLLNDIAGGAQKLGQRMKEEILQDDEARDTLFVLSMEDGLMNIIHAAERALHALERRDALLSRREAQLKQREQQQQPSPHISDDAND